MQSKRVAAYLLGQLSTLVFTGVVLFWSAGRLDWWAAWAAIAVWTVWFAALDWVVLRIQPGLLAERLSPPKDAKAWDRALLSSIRLVELARYIIAGLDQRSGWSENFPLAVQGVGLIAFLLGTALFAWAMACNPFFSQVVRIQTERGHAVVSTGPYRWVRHPGYLATIVTELSLSALLGSWWAILASAVLGILFILRTVLEDRTLQAELPGYREYAGQVRGRLVPRI